VSGAETEAPSSHLVEVAFRGNRKEFFAWEGEAPPPLRAGVVVEVERGEDFGRVHSTGALAEVRCRGCAHGCGTAPPPRRVLRLATPDDERRERERAAEHEPARRTAAARARAAGLVMKVTDAEWQWDRRKLTLYFTAEKRVDFRDLVRELAQLFRTRIELRQIGVRDEAKRLSGVGRCGREYCSASWMQELRPVNLGVAKDQHLSLNPQQISGACGRLMCCLRHEHDFYVQSRRRFPKEGKVLVTARGEERVLACDIFREQVTLRGPEGETRVVPLAALRAEVVQADGAWLQAGTAGEGAAVAPMPPAAAAAPPVTPTPAPRAAHDTGAPDAASASAAVTDTDGDDADAEAEGVDEPDDAGGDEAPGAADREARRKRRRGRRGGRRVRAAEQRRAATDDPPPRPDPS
jgi:cell fate regulator YaaT (PSP1 superfamily)